MDETQRLEYLRYKLEFGPLKGRLSIDESSIMVDRTHELIYQNTWCNEYDVHPFENVLTNCDPDEPLSFGVLAAYIPSTMPALLGDVGRYIVNKLQMTPLKGQVVYGSRYNTIVFDDQYSIFKLSVNGVNGECVVGIKFLRGININKISTSKKLAEHEWISIYEFIACLITFDSRSEVELWVVSSKYLTN